jgi:hypothetical protein
LLAQTNFLVAKTPDRLKVKLSAREAKLGLVLRVARLVAGWNCQKHLNATEQAQQVQMHFVHLPLESAEVRSQETGQESCC